MPLPPAELPLRHRGRMRKQWRYVGVYCDEFMLCAARVRVGPMGQTFWAFVDRSSGKIEERTGIRLPGARGEVWSERGEGGAWPIGSDEPGVVTHVDSKLLKATLRIGEGEWVESVCPTGEGSGPSEGYVWTRKRIAPIVCKIELPDGRRFGREAFGIEDESCGYHPRRTVWSWSAGVGTAADGRAVGWNLVSGINDPPANSERAIWVEGEAPREPGPVSFDELEGIEFSEGGRLDFHKEAERKAAQNLGIVAYDYVQPFGSFSGSLAGIELESALGVMEYHDARW